MSKKQFTLDSWLKDKSQKIVTRCGFPVRIVCTDVKRKDYPILALVERDDQEEYQSFTKDGRFSLYNRLHDNFDLFIVTDEVSEDEKVRKEIINYFQCQSEEEPTRKEIHNKWLAWLEKQGEPTDKGEISDGYHTFNELYYYRMLYNAAFFNMLPKEWVHKSKKHHDGEECFGGGWFIVMANLPTGQISNHYELKDWNLFRIPEKEVADKWDGHTPQEAADRLYKYLLENQGQKEKDILEDAILDGYILDGNENGLIAETIRYKHEKQSEQKSDKVKPKFKVGDKIYLKPEYRMPDDDTPIANTVKEIRRIDDKHYRFDGSYIFIEDQDKYELVEQKPAWSEEDEHRLNSCLNILQPKTFVGNTETINTKWLKSLKGRVQPKQEWSEEDENRFNRICGVLKRYEMELGASTNDIDWLKSLRHQNRWKPSDEQMEILLQAVAYFGVSWANKDYLALQSLYFDLKKLKEGKV